MEISAAVAAFACACALAADPYLAPGPGSRYATDAYPGFDSESKILPRPQKEPAFFKWFGALESDTPEGQAEIAAAYAREGEWKKAKKAYDALVAQWPASTLAPGAQKAVADICREHLDDAQDAFDEYKYLAEFFSSQCDFAATVRAMYEMAVKMREDGRKILFFRFANSTDVRRAFESVVKCAPGAPFAPAAMLAAAELREEEDDLENAVKVYENIRTTYPRSAQAQTALMREAAARMTLIDRHDYNRPRCLDTIRFLDMAAETAAGADEREQIAAWRKKAAALVEDEAYRAAKFYDSKTRTRASAISAYERYLREYPAGEHAAEARERMNALKWTEQTVLKGGNP